MGVNASTLGHAAGHDPRAGRPLGTISCEPHWSAATGGLAGAWAAGGGHTGGLAAGTPRIGGPTDAAQTEPCALLAGSLSGSSSGSSLPGMIDGGSTDGDSACGDGGVAAHGALDASSLPVLEAGRLVADACPGEKAVSGPAVSWIHAWLARAACSRRTSPYEEPPTAITPRVNAPTTPYRRLLMGAPPGRFGP
jgi:hypothetical protein